MVDFSEGDDNRIGKESEPPPVTVPKSMQLSTVWIADADGDWHLLLATEIMHVAAEVYAALVHMGFHRGIAISTTPIPLQRYHVKDQTL